MKRLLIFLCSLIPIASGATESEKHRELARDIFKELVEINTTNSEGDNTAAARAMAARLLKAGYAAEDVVVLGQERDPRKGNLVARLRGSGNGKPILLLAHIDVVEANPAEWTLDPFVFVERDGYFYGRGTSDDKDMSAIWVSNLIRYRQEGFVPDRDIIVALTADEEWGDYNGVRWLLDERRSLIDAEFALNEGGNGEIRKGKYVLNEVQLAEKTYASFRLEAKSAGGHSSLPTADNAIYHLSKALSRLADFEFPVSLNPVTRSYFARVAQIESGAVAADMAAVAANTVNSDAADRLSQNSFYNALLRTTCVATLLDAGHAENALPLSASATVNCRILPHQSVAQIHKTLVDVIADTRISVNVIGEPLIGPASPLDATIMGKIEAVTEELWPGIAVVPMMITSATDGLFLRNAGIPTYGVSGIFQDIEDIRAHGRDERIRVQSFYEGQEFLYRLVKSLATATPPSQ